MQDNFDIKIKEYGLNALLFFVLFILLLIPSRVGINVVYSMDLIQVNQNYTAFAIIVGILVTYFGLLGYFNELLVGRFRDLVSVKYLIIILLIFGILADIYYCYRYVDAYLEYQPLIERRAIVWHDVEELPLDVQYSDLPMAYMAVVTFLRTFIIGFFLYILFQEKREIASISSRRQRTKRRKKTVEELKANVHPSVLKSYQKKDD